MTKEFYVTKCQKCGEITDITMSEAVQKFINLRQTLEEELNDTNKRRFILRKQKVGQIRGMHILIKQLYDIMTPEQRTKAREFNQQLRDEFKRIEKLTK